MTAAVSIDDSHPHTVRVTLGSPATGNRLDPATVRDFLDALDRAERMPNTTAFVIDAAGDTFCAGMPLTSADHAGWHQRVSSVQSLLTRLTTSPLATVALVEGAVIGGGVGLVAACDQVVAGPLATFRLTEVRLGLIPALVLPLLARRVGPHRAFSLALTAEELSSGEATRLGLADICCDEPARHLRRVLRSLRAADRGAVRALKRYYADLYPCRLAPGDQIPDALAQRLSDPGVLARIGELRQAGLIE